MSLDCNGNLTQSVEGYPICDGTWVISPEPLYELYQLLNAVFSTPDGADIAAAFMVGIGLPLVCYLTAWGYGAVVNTFGRRYLDD